MMRQHLNQMRQAAQMSSQSEAKTRIGIVTSFDPNTYSAKVMLQPENLETGWLPVTSIWTGNAWGVFCPPSSGDMVEVQFQEGCQSSGFIVGRFYNDSERPLPAPSGEFWLVHKSGSLMKFHNDGSVELVTAQDLNATVGRNANVTVAGNVVSNVTGNVTETVNGNLTANVSGAANVAVSGNITSSAAAWNHTGPVNITGNTKITGTTISTGAITGQGGMAISGGAGATVSGSMAITGGNVTADGISLKTHTHSGVQAGSSSTGAPQ